MTGIIIGRFQVPYLHEGHKHLIKTAMQMCDEVVIFLGCRIGRDERNPYGIPHRMKILREVFPNIHITPIFDRTTDAHWSLQIDMTAAKFKDPVLIHSRDSFASHYKGSLKLIEVAELPGYSGTKLRNESSSK